MKEQLSAEWFFSRDICGIEVEFQFVQGISVKSTYIAQIHYYFVFKNELYGNFKKGALKSESSLLFFILSYILFFMYMLGVQ